MSPPTYSKRCPFSPKDQITIDIRIKHRYLVWFVFNANPPNVKRHSFFYEKGGFDWLELNVRKRKISYGICWEPIRSNIDNLCCKCIETYGDTFSTHWLFAKFSMVLWVMDNPCVLLQKRFWKRLIDIVCPKLDYVFFTKQNIYIS